MGPKPKPLEERYQVDPETGCWVFQGATDGFGYGNMKFKGRQARAHRVAAHLWKGFDLDSKLLVCHHCDNPPCINPNHLYIGTKADNARDMVARGRQYVVHINGLDHWNGRLSKEQVEEIRVRVARGEKQSAVARYFEISPTHVSNIVRGKARRV